MRDTFKAILGKFKLNEPVVRVSVMESTGSTPRSAGACMAVFQDNSLVGTIGGGTVEHASWKAALDMQPGTFSTKSFDLANSDAAKQGMVCGGAMTVLLDAMLPTKENTDFVEEVLYRLASQGTAIRTHLDANGVVLKREVVETATATSSIAPSGDVTVFTEPLPGPRVVHFFGAGHVAQATSRIAAFTGFQVTVTDDRNDFANAERFPDAFRVEVVENLKDCVPTDLGRQDHVVIMTRGHMHDREVLAQALGTDAGYIGMIGSKKKKKAVYDSLLQAGFTQTDLARVHCPIGLSIGAETPEEIAVSIMGEIIALASA